MLEKIKIGLDLGSYTVNSATTSLNIIIPGYSWNILNVVSIINLSKNSTVYLKYGGFMGNLLSYINNTSLTFTGVSFSDTDIFDIQFEIPDRTLSSLTVSSNAVKVINIDPTGVSIQQNNSTDSMSTYSNVFGDFLITPSGGTRIVEIIGCPISISILNVATGIAHVYKQQINSGYTINTLPLTQIKVTTDSVLGHYFIEFLDSLTLFNDTDIIELILQGPKIALDQTNNQQIVSVNNFPQDNIIFSLNESNNLAITSSLVAYEIVYYGTNYRGFPTTYTINSGGTGYANGAQVITVINPDGFTNATLNVTVTGGIVTTINSIATPGGGYLNTTLTGLTTTGGTGTGFKVNATANASITILTPIASGTNAILTASITNGIPTGLPSVSTAGGGFRIFDKNLPSTNAYGSGFTINVLDVTGFYYPTNAGTTIENKHIYLQMNTSGGVITTIEGSNDINATIVEWHDCTNIFTVCGASRLNIISYNKLDSNNTYYYNDVLSLRCDIFPFRYYRVKSSVITTTNKSNYYQF